MDLRPTLLSLLLCAPGCDAGDSSSSAPDLDTAQALPDLARSVGDAASSAPDLATPPKPGKRGAAYGFKTAEDLAAPGPSVSWWYNWSPQPDVASPGVEFVPMVWGGTFDINQLKTQIPPDAKYLLGFNEPNFASQSNLTPGAAAALWPQLEQLADERNLLLVSPALNYCGGQCNETDPFVWLQKFFDACTNCRVDFIALHWYACTKSALQSYLSNYKAKFDKPLWLTEFSCLDDQTITVDKEMSYLPDALSVLEADPIVFRYSWFTGRFMQQPAVDLLDAQNGVLTPLGKAYAAYPSN